MINKRLKKLSKAGYIKCKSQLPNSDFLYSLGAKGKDYLMYHSNLEVEDIKLSKGSRYSNLDHLLTLNSVRISLSLASQSNSNWELLFFRPEWELKAERNPNILPLMPDAIFQLQVDTNGSMRMLNFSLEIDLGNENPIYFAKMKIRKYLEIKKSGIPFFGLNDFKVLTITSSMKRLIHLLEATIAETISDNFLFTVLEYLNEETFSKRIFLSAHNFSEKVMSGRSELGDEVYKTLTS